MKTNKVKKRELHNFDIKTIIINHVLYIRILYDLITKLLIWLIHKYKTKKKNIVQLTNYHLSDNNS